MTLSPGKNHIPLPPGRYAHTLSEEEGQKVPLREGGQSRHKVSGQGDGKPRTMIKRTYNRNLKTFTRKLRKNSTKGEIRLWCELLRNKKMYGYQFLRQFPIKNYIVDFICRKLNLIIEVDGYSHNFKQDNDKKRDSILETIGYKIIRFTEKQVKYDINNVSRAIEIYIEEFESEKTSACKKEPHPPASAETSTPPF